MNPFAKPCTGPPEAADGTAPDTCGTDDPLPKPPNELDDGFTPDDKPPSIDEPLPDPALGLIPPTNGEAETPPPATELTPGSPGVPDVALCAADDSGMGSADESSSVRPEDFPSDIGRCPFFGASLSDSRPLFFSMSAGDRGDIGLWSRRTPPFSVTKSTARTELSRDVAAGPFEPEAPPVQTGAAATRAPISAVALVTAESTAKPASTTIETILCH